MSRIGVSKDDTLVLYGDFNNWFAAFAFWVFQYYGHKKIKLMNGGRKKWELENRNYTNDEPSVTLQIMFPILLMKEYAHI